MLFPPDFLTRVEHLSIVSKRVFRGRLLAQRRTMQLGSGVEFSDHRKYAAGDDFRYLDWNIYARHGDLLLKRFEEEDDMHVYLSNERETDLRPNETSNSLAVQTASAASWFARPLWFYLAAVACLASIVEWLLHLRRILT
jgi:uncharacterized protein (DUF58 family)